MAGWGRTRDVPAPTFPEFLQALQVKVIDWNQCKMAWPRLLERHHICAGLPDKDKGACKVSFYFTNFYDRL